MSWQLVTVAPNSEQRVARMLSFFNFDFHIFRVKRKVVRRGKVVEKLFPFFPGYIFVKAKQCWDLIKSFVGVVDFVRLGRNIADIADREVEKLLRYADASGVITLPEEQSGRFRLGDKVRVVGTHSLVFGSAGLYQHSVGIDKAYVLLPWFNGQLVGTLVEERDLERYDYRTRVRRRSRRRRNRIRKDAATPSFVESGVTYATP